MDIKNLIEGVNGDSQSNKALFKSILRTLLAEMVRHNVKILQSYGSTPPKEQARRICGNRRVKVQANVEDFMGLDGELLDCFCFEIATRLLDGGRVSFKDLFAERVEPFDTVIFYLVL